MANDVDNDAGEIYEEVSSVRTHMVHTTVPEKNSRTFQGLCCIFQGPLSDCSEYYNGFKT